MSALDEARAVAKQRAKATGAAYLYRRRDGNGYTIRDYVRGPLSADEYELIEILGAVPS